MKKEDYNKAKHIIESNISVVIDSVIQEYNIEYKKYEDLNELDAFPDNFNDWFESNYL